MHVVMDALPLSPPVTGVGQYTKNLAHALLRLPDVRVSFWGHFTLGAEQAIDRELRILKGETPMWAFGSRALALLNPVSLSRYLWARWSARYAVHHATNFVLRRFDAPSVATFHDLSVLRYPNFHPTERVKFMEKRFARTMAAAHSILTPSQFVRDEVIERFGLHPERVVATPLGVSGDFRPRADSEILHRLARYGLRPDGYVLMVGTLEPRKNIGLVLAAYSQLPSSLQSRFPIVHAGPPGWLSKDIETEGKNLERAGHFWRLGYVPQEDLPYLYAGACVFVFPSYYEGFGLPVLEAMAAGVPVIASNTSSLPEVVGDAGKLINPHDPTALAHELSAILSDPSVRSVMRHSGLDQAKRFTWESCAKRTLDVYRAAQSAHA
jgi:glycosyltransferase involved in cell wall biosynthesis